MADLKRGYHLSTYSGINPIPNPPNLNSLQRAKQRPSDFGKWPKMLTGCSDLDDIYNYTGSTKWREEFRCYPHIQNRWTIVAYCLAFITFLTLLEFHPGFIPHCRCYLCWFFEQVRTEC